MAKPELGLKRVCVACGTKFYDLMRSPAVCPKCATEQRAEQARLRRGAAPTEEKVKKRAGVPAEADAVEVDLEDVEADAALEDDAGLEEDDEDEAIGDDIEVETDRDEEV